MSSCKLAEPCFVCETPRQRAAPTPSRFTACSADSGLQALGCVLGGPAVEGLHLLSVVCGQGLTAGPPFWGLST